ncbi:hypothetical protein [Brachybacterium sp. AOP35-5H-19]|uniref:hypothetical protein n=1 Tax=Brachybacterium sp. AOP35-5H-19 TaxID=3457685 RepID=UPI004034A6FE
MRETTRGSTARATVPRCAVFGVVLADAIAPGFVPALLERHRAAPRHPRIRCADDDGHVVDTGRGDAVPVIDGWAADELWAVDVATSCPHCLALEGRDNDHRNMRNWDTPDELLSTTAHWLLVLVALALARDLAALFDQRAAVPGYGPDDAGATPPAERPQMLALTDSTLTAAPPATAMPVPYTRCVVTPAA